ncbi:shieldin complex subunit 1 isoform X3 [Varanus komodoensis]|uniref:Shieldin complex subunit 1 n=2 Tax=Varanus komodoensis TaxID=61221 RepID=A0A8D2J9I7_VARKO|nr:shieldin complex subunit 1 isoform X3 [Varanus komodoensis]
MEGNGTLSSCHSEESSFLDLPCVLTAESFLRNPSPGRNDEIPHSEEAFVSPASTVFDTDSNSIVFSEHNTGVDATLWPGPCETTQPMTDESQPRELPLSWKYEEPSIEKSLEVFYGTCCQKKPSGGSPAYEAASQSVSAKIADLTDQEGMAYALKSLQIAQMVLNRDADKILPQHFSSTCFSTSTKTSISLEETKQMPGLSDEILQFILKGNLTK